MKRDNFIRIGRDERNTPIYRFTTVERLLALIVQKKNTLVSPRKWDDPFENALAMHMRLRRPDGSTSPYPFRNRVYGQCWTLREEADAFWRMYVPKGEGVRIRSTIGKLHKSLENECEVDRRLLSCFIGRVMYSTEEAITYCFNNKEWVEQNFRSQGTYGHVDTLLLKRVEFEPEEEVRLLYLDPHNVDHGDCFAYSVNPSSLISEITFDPRMEDANCNTFESILKTYDFSGEINKSSLYKAPNIDICF